MILLCSFFSECIITLLTLFFFPGTSKVFFICIPVYVRYFVVAMGLCVPIYYSRRHAGAVLSDPLQHTHTMPSWNLSVGFCLQ